MNTSDTLPVKHGQDVSDWLAAGHTADELKAIVSNAPEWKLVDSLNTKTNVDQNDKSKSKLTPLRTVRLSDVVAEDVDWLWEPFIALGTFVIN